MKEDQQLKKNFEEIQKEPGIEKKIFIFIDIRGAKLSLLQQKVAAFEVEIGDEHEEEEEARKREEESQKKEEVKKKEISKKNKGSVQETSQKKKQNKNFDSDVNISSKLYFTFCLGIGNTPGQV